MPDWHNYFLICHAAGLKKGTPLTISHTVSFQVGSLFTQWCAWTRLFYAFILRLYLQLQCALSPEVGTLGLLDIQCRPPPSRRTPPPKKKDHEFFMGSRMFVFFAGLFHAILYIRAHAHLSIMMGYAKSWWRIRGIGWLGAAPIKKREMLLSTHPHK